MIYNAPGVKPETCAARFLPLAGPSMCTTVRVSGSWSTTFPKAPRACDAAPVAHCEPCRPLAGAIYSSEQRPTRERLGALEREREIERRTVREILGAR
jgi:hypothetical protein